MLEKKNLRKGWESFKKFCDFIWNDDSLLSWVLNIIIAIVLIKFIIYPVLGFLLASPYPIVAVISGSMEHDGSFDDWWQSTARLDGAMVTQETFYKSYDITEDDFKSFPYNNGFNVGDIMILYGTKPKDLKIGDVIVFDSPARPDPIIHRIIDKREVNGKYYFTTKGDHNPEVGARAIKEDNISEDRVIARAVLRIPIIGYVKIVAYNVYMYTIGIFS